MPYITKAERIEIDSGVNHLETTIYSCGGLNYAITKLIHSYLLDRHFCYKGLNEVIGVLECAKLELYRQVVAPYENKKKLENGAISELDSKTLEDVR